MTLDTAWCVRAWILRELDSEAGGIPWAEAWSEMYDPCVFRDNGLRMVGSNKAIICPTCNGKSFKRGGDEYDGQVCFGCQNAGRIDQGRPYNLAFVAGPDGNPDNDLTAHYKSLGNVFDLVELCSIRVMPDVQPVSLTGPDFDMMVKIEKWVKADRGALRGQTADAKKKQVLFYTPPPYSLTKISERQGPKGL